MAPLELEQRDSSGIPQGITDVLTRVFKIRCADRTPH